MRINFIKIIVLLIILIPLILLTSLFVINTINTDQYIKEIENIPEKGITANPNSVNTKKVTEFNNKIDGYLGVTVGSKVKELLKELRINVIRNEIESRYVPIIWFNEKNEVIRYNLNESHRTYNNLQTYLNHLEELRKEINDESYYYIEYSRSPEGVTNIVYIFDNEESFKPIDNIEKLYIRDDEGNLVYKDEELFSNDIGEEEKKNFNNQFIELYDATQVGSNVINLINVLISNANTNRYHKEYIPSLCISSKLAKYHDYGDNIDDFDEYLNELKWAKNKIDEDLTYYISFEYYPNGLIRNIIIFDK